MKKQFLPLIALCLLFVTGCQEHTHYFRINPMDHKQMQFLLEVMASHTERQDGCVVEVRRAFPPGMSKSSKDSAVYIAEWMCPNRTGGCRTESLLCSVWGSSVTTFAVESTEGSPVGAK